MSGKLQPGSRGSRALDVLAGHPDGLLTPQIAQALGDYPHALIYVAEALRRQEAHGHVTAAKACPGATILWRITEKGRHYACGVGTASPVAPSLAP